MAAEIGRILGVIQVKDESKAVIANFQAGVQGLLGTMQDLGGGFATVGNVAQTAFSGFATGGPIGAAIGGGTAVLGEFVKATKQCIESASESQRVFTSLAAAVERSGTSWATVEQGTKNALAAMQRTTTYSDEQLAAALERLMTFGLSYDESMKALAQSLDFAAAKHMDLESAATIVGKAMDGNTAILKRYGVDVATSKDQTAALKDAHAAAGIAIKAMGAEVDAWVASVTTAIEADSTFQSGLAGAKDKAQFLVDQFKTGNIDLSQFTEAMASLGVQLDEAKIKGGSAEEVLKALNAQYGGAAQEAAKTYAGTQERLKNATDEVAEKIGNMLLPALTSITEGIIPVVDWIGKGIDAYQSWTAEVLKAAPDWLKTSTYVDALGEAFSGLWKWMEDFWGFLTETFGPVLKELGDALGEVFDALAPIGEAFGEVWAAITGGQEGGDWLKDFLKFVAQFIREVVVPAIKEAVPVIKGFAEAFKAAADFALPIITEIKNAVVGFINALKDAFQGFYNWLIGASLWSDLWDAVISKTAGAIGQLLSDLAGKFFDPMKTAFTNTVDAVKTTWDQGWQAVQTTFETISSQVQSSLNTRFEEMKSFVTTNLGEYAPIANDALTAMQGAMNAVMSLVRGDWQGFLDNMNLAMTSFWSAIQGITDVAFRFLQESFTGSMNAIKGTLNEAISAMQAAWGGFSSFMSGAISGFQGAVSQASSWLSSTLSGMQSAASAAVNYIAGEVAAAWNSVQSSTQDFTDKMYKHSIWPDMLEAMQSQTQAALGNIVGDFEGAFSNVALSVPTVGRRTEAATAAAPTFAFPPITIPVTDTIIVQLDGEVITRTVKKRLIEQRQYGERSIGRLT